MTEYIYNSKIWIERQALFCNKKFSSWKHSDCLLLDILETKQLTTEDQVTMLLKLGLMNKVLCVSSRYIKFSDAWQHFISNWKGDIWD